jgi:hypothetical protein
MTNITDSTTVPGEQESDTGPKSTVPSLKTLALPPLIVNGAIFAVLVVEKHVLIAFSIMGGFVVGCILYWALHYFAEHVFGTLVSSSSGAPAPANMMMFGVLAGGKFVVIGVLMYVMIAVMHFSVAAFVVGFMITQICVSASVVSRMSKLRLIG